MANYNSYVFCFYPGCTNTSVSAPDKLFFNVPTGERRKEWWRAAGRTDVVSEKSTFNCCEDHFKVEDDVSLWFIYKNLEEAAKKNFRLRLRPGVLPRRFENHSNESFSVGAEQHVEVDEVVEDSLSGQMQALSLEKPQLGSTDVETFSYIPQRTLSFGPITTKYYLPKADVCQGASSESCKPTVSVSHQPISLGKRRRVENKDDAYVYDFSQFSDASSVGSKEPVLSQGTKDFEKSYFRLQAQKLNMQIMSENPRVYLGLSHNTMGLIESLEKYTKLTKIDLFLVFRKIRLNESITILEHTFGLDETAVSNSLNEAIPLVGAYLKKFIFWPDKKIIQANVPIAFRAHYGATESIIDCFEVQIEKPTNVVFQTLTFSSYKSCNTAKFLVSICPDGFINFISHGFGGRSSDTVIVEKSGYLDVLKPNTLVMADRGFKHVEPSLLEKDCRLVRPPTVATGSIMTKDEARHTKVIASLRINVERVIRRIREFSFVKPHSCYHHALTDLIDNIVIIVCALSNLQSPIVRQD